MRVVHALHGAGVPAGTDSSVRLIVAATDRRLVGRHALSPGLHGGAQGAHLRLRSSLYQSRNTFSSSQYLSFSALYATRISQIFS